MEVSGSIIISVLALILSGVSISWNIYRDAILKARLKVNVQISGLVQPGRSLGCFIAITGVNHGPGSLICESIYIKRKSFWKWLIRKNEYGFIPPDYTNQMSSRLPKKLEVGEKINLFFPYKEKMFLATKPTHVGVCDSFGRVHWANSKSLKETITVYLKAFPHE